MGLVLLLAACGRIDYERIGGGSKLDAGPTRDGASGRQDAADPADADDDAGDGASDGGLPRREALPDGSAAGCADEALGPATGRPVATGTTEGRDSDSVSCFSAGIVAPDVAFAWVAPNDGRYVIDTCGSDFDTVLMVRDGDCSGSQLGCSVEAIPPLPSGDCEAGDSVVRVELTGGQRVIIVVDGIELASGAYQLNIEAL